MDLQLNLTEVSLAFDELASPLLHHLPVCESGLICLIILELGPLGLRLGFDRDQKSGLQGCID